jgi:hypothetical protein
MSKAGITQGYFTCYSPVSTVTASKQAENKLAMPTAHRKK